GIGVLLRWTGHTDKPLSGWQPKTGWYPLGAVTWFRRDFLEIFGNHDTVLASKVRPLSYGTTYMLRARVETMDGRGDLYSMKVWEQGQPEPANWDLVGEAREAEPAAGSMMLIAHYADATFGKVEITPIGMQNVTVDVTDTTATISWYTGLPSDSLIEYGTSSSYTDNVFNGENVNSHSMTITGLLPNTLYHFKITSVDTDGVTSSTNDMTFLTTGPDNSGIDSDDFNSTLLDPNTWTFHDPVGDCSYELIGTDTKDAYLTLSVPGGTGHDVWTSGNNSARIMQDTLDVDFEVEVKFESVLANTYQIQGIIIEQDPGEYLRFDFYRNSGQIRNFVAIFRGYSVSIKKNDVIPDVNPYANPIYMRIRRQGDVWTQWYSHDGSTWIESISFSYPMTVNSVGPFAGNAIGSGSPEFNCYVDYFFNTAATIVPEDNWFAPPERFTAYMDLNAQTGDNNHANVTVIVPASYEPNYIPPAIHPYVNWTLKDFDTGIDLDVTMNVIMDIETPIDEGTDSEALTDAAMTFGGIVDASGGYELIAPDDYFMITFDNLDPAKEYELAMTYNNGQPDYANRVSMLRLWQADTFTQASSDGVVINSEDSASLGFGANTTNGHVARWTDITASDGSFSVIAEHDDSFGGAAAYTMTSVMLKHMPEIDVTPPVIGNIEAATTETTAQITFTTDEPATCSVACGTTTAYEEGSVNDDNLLTDHSVTLDNLQSGTTYHFQVTSTDESGNAAQSEDIVFTTVATVAAFNDGFGTYQTGADPTGWFDTKAGNSLAQDDSLFKILDAGDGMAFGTTSPLTNIHSHYVVGQSLEWTDYQYSGRVKITNAGAGVGLTFFSDYPNSDKYYRLRRYGSGSFHISPHGTSITSGNTSSGVTPQINIWYRFVIEVENADTQTEIRAKIWQDGTTEPANWQIECQDA
ncbi:MAG: fibronectin type III domain-containing protein, partial [Planctomycetes bacterium]|nr:fibronectin type III domain-containing protein [Planctomycetota bacterium]